MKERPILFNGDMVRAILSGTKTQTRRIVKPQPFCPNTKMKPNGDGSWFPWGAYENDYDYIDGISRKWICPFGVEGDRLWVRETFALLGGYMHADSLQPTVPIYRTSWPEIEDNGSRRTWKPSIHMPRWASRIMLEITGVRVERLQAITEEDAKAEGVDGRFHPEDPKLWTWRDYSVPDRYAYGSMFGPRESFEGLWESINGKGSWDLNPWVWVVEFKKL